MNIILKWKIWRIEAAIKSLIRASNSRLKIIVKINKCNIVKIFTYNFVFSVIIGK